MGSGRVCGGCSCSGSGRASAGTRWGDVRWAAASAMWLACVPAVASPLASSMDPQERASLGRVITFPQLPALSPDGALVTFSFDDDVWIARSSGGQAVRLTNHPASEGRSAFSRDGSRVLFESDRDGARNIYEVVLLESPGGVLPMGGPVTRITRSDRSETLAGESADGRSVLFTATRTPTLFRHARMHRAPLGGDGPVAEVTGAFGIEPNESADGSVIVFTRGRYGYDRPRYRGSGASDLFRLDVASGQFARLTSWNGNDGQPALLPDGAVVFVSSRDGQNNIWRLEKGRSDEGRRSGPGLTQLTFFQPSARELSIAHGVRDLAVAGDGSLAAFVLWDRLMTLDLRKPDAEPKPIELVASGDSDSATELIITLGAGASEAALSPDGATVAIVDRGEILIRSTAEDRPTRRVTTSAAARERDIAWSPDNQWLYYSSDASGEQRIYRGRVSLAREDLAPKPAEPDKPETAAEAPAAKPQPAATDPSGAKPADPAAAPVSDPAAEPAPAAEDKGRAPADAKSPEKKSAKPKVDHGKRWSEALSFESELVVDQAGSHAPMPSPDGRWLMFLQSRGDLMLMDLRDRSVRRVFESWNDPEVIWASDSRHVVYAVQDEYFNSDIFLLDVLDPEAEAVNLTRHPDLDSSPRLSADGKVLVFRSERNGENFQFDVYAVFLDRELEGKTDYELKEYFEAAAKEAKKRKPIEPVSFDDGADGKESPKSEPARLRFDAEDAYLRLRRIVGLDSSVGALELLPGGDRVLFATSIDGSAGVYSVDYKGSDRKSVTSGPASGLALNLDGSKLVFVRGGTASAVPVSGGKVDSYAMSLRTKHSLVEEKRQKFREAARLLRDNFYHYDLKGLDWDGLTRRYETLAMATRTTAEFNAVVDLLFGELDGSHLGIGGGRSDFSPTSLGTGYLGIDVRPHAQGYEIARVVMGSPADRARPRLAVGDVLTSIDGQPLAHGAGPVVDLITAMEGTAGRETLFAVIPASVEEGDGESPNERRQLIVPGSSGSDSALRYQDEVERNRKRVLELSGGRLGYLHIRGMDIGSVRVFERDLFAAADGRDGLIIDVRDNGGGSTADILLASLTAPAHARTVPRGVDPQRALPDAYPRDRRLIYAYTRPVGVLINEHSFSNAEIFAHAIKNIGRGPLIGTATFGGVISTGSASLVDGASVRMPFRGWYLPDGRDMENNGAQPDVDVPRLPEDDAAGRDAQMEAAVAEMLRRIDSAKRDGAAAAR